MGIPMPVGTGLFKLKHQAIDGNSDPTKPMKGPERPKLLLA